MKKEIVGICICLIMLFITTFCVFTGGAILLAQILAVPTYIAFIIFTVIYIGGCLLTFKLLTADAPDEKQAFTSLLYFFKNFCYNIYMIRKEKERN